MATVDNVGAINLQSTHALGSLSVQARGTVMTGGAINNSGALNVNGRAIFGMLNGESINLTADNAFTTDPEFLNLICAPASG